MSANYAELLLKLTHYIKHPVAQIQQSNEVNELSVLAANWLHGEKVDWQLLYTDIKPQKIALPGYPFAKRRCWVANINSENIIPVISNNSVEISDELKQWLYNIEWQISPIYSEKENHIGKWLIFSDYELGFLLQDYLGREHCYYCFTGDQYQQFDDQVFYMDPENAEHYQKLLSALSQSVK